MGSQRLPMGVIKDISGSRFGRLLLLEPRGANYWCRCDCGTECLVYRGNLTQDQTKSCGCLKSEITSKRMHELNQTWLTTIGTTLPNITPELRSLRLQIRTYKRNAEKRGISFALTNHEFKDVAEQACHYCGSDGPAGLDRVDPNNGYTTSNVVPCCKRCNQAKNNMSLDKFLGWVSAVYHFALGKEVV